MKKILFLLILPLALFGAKILSYNVYDRSDRVDVMFTFDTPYDGIISQQTLDSKIIIKLADATIESEKTRTLSSKYLTNLIITPITNYTQIVASIPSDVQLEASKTSDSYGLRLRFSKSDLSQNKTVLDGPTSSLATLPTKNTLEISPSYYIVIAILLASLVFAFLLKKKVKNLTDPKNLQKGMQSVKKPWMFNGKTEEVSGDVHVRFTKQLDPTNKVMMLDFDNLSYLVLLAGNNNIVLDKFQDNKPVNINDFESLLRSRDEELNSLLKVQNKEKEPFQTYKEKAASIAYDA